MPAKNIKAKKSRAVREAAIYRNLSGPLFARKVFEFKNYSSPEEVFQGFSQLFSNKEDLTRIHGSMFPRDVSELFSVPALYRPAHITNELAWAAAMCCLFGNELKGFVSQRCAFQRDVIDGSQDVARHRLDEIERANGVSIWLLQARIATEQLWRGAEEGRRLADEVEQSLSKQSISRLLIHFFNRRTDALLSKDKIKQELKSILDAHQNHAFELFIKDKVLSPLSPQPNAMASSLLFEAQSSLIDLYEEVIRSALLIGSDPSIPSRAAQQIGMLLTALHRATSDERLVPAIVAIKGKCNSVHVDGERARLIDCYADERHVEFVGKADDYLRRVPEDMLVRTLRVRCAMATGGDVAGPGEEAGVLHGLSAHFANVLSLTDAAYGSALSLFDLAERFPMFDWAYYLHSLTMHELREEELDFPGFNLRRVILLDQRVTPYIQLVQRKEIIGPEAQETRVVFEASPVTTSVVRAMLEGLDPGGHISETKRNRLKARHLIAHHRYDEARDCLGLVAGSGGDADAARACAAIALINARQGKWLEAAAAVVRGHVEKGVIGTVFPVAAVAEQLDGPDSWGDSIDPPLLLEMYSSYVGSDKWPHLRLAFENFQLQNGIQHAEQLARMSEKIGFSRVRAYLDRVWVPEVMRQTVLYSSADEMEQVRIAVCRVLADIDPDNRARYADEIRERVKNQEIKRGATLVEQSKVYVDVSAIKRALKTRLGGSYARYKAAVQTAPARSEAIDKLYDIASALGGAKDQSVTQVLSRIEVIGLLSRTDADEQFEALFSEISNEFLNGDHGLNAYLSTRVRHGKLASALRRPVADENLVTSRVGGGTSYLPNSYWLERLASAPAKDVERASQAFDRFSSEFDAILDEINRKLIRINVMQKGVQSDKEDEQGVFTYWSTQLERKFLQDKDRRSSSMDELIDHCIEVLWEKTDKNLLALQNLLDSSIRARIGACFDRLQDAIHDGCESHLEGFHNSLARARTETNLKLTHVIRWFKRNEVYDRKDYPLDFAVQVAKNILDKTLVEAANWSGLTVDSQLDGGLMPGRTLDGMVDIFDDLIVNAILRSGLTPDQLLVDVKLVRAGDVYRVIVSNNVGPDATRQEALGRVNEIRLAIEKNDSRRKAQLEGGSGLHKVWRELNAPTYASPTLCFGFEDGRFYVDIGFSLEMNSESPLS